MDPKQKIVSGEDLALRVRELQAAGKQVVFTNGCFDILHAGHVDYLYKARAEGDALVVGLNSDHSVRVIKEEGRPILGEEHRAAVLAGLGCVDYVTIFNQPDPLDLIVALRPDILVKGADWPEEGVVGGAEVKSYGGRVNRIEIVYSVSTSEIIRRIVACYGSGGRRSDQPGASG